MSEIFYKLSSAYDSHKPEEEIHEIYRQAENKDECDQNKGQRPLLYCAASYGDAGAIDILLDAGAKAMVTNKYGENPLHALGELSECRWNKPSDEDIYRAAKRLYEAKVSILRKDDNGLTCYHMAAKKANYPMIQALLDCGAKLTGTDNHGYTAIHFACMEVRHTVQSLVYSQRHFDELKPIPDDIRPNWRKIEEEKIERVTKELAADKKMLDDYFKIVKTLVEAGLDADAKDNYGHDALYYAVDSDAKKIAAFLKGEDVENEQSLTAGGMTLHQAVIKKDAAAVKALIAMGADMNEIYTEYRFEGRTPLALACGMVHNECVAALLEGGADPNFKAGEQGRTAMWFLIRDENSVLARHHKDEDVIDIFRILLKAGMDVNAFVDDQSNTALIMTCNDCRIPSLIEELINIPCDVNMANLAGQTALMFALKERELKRSENVVISLLENDAKIDVCDRNGKTPLMYAASNSNHTAAKVFAQLLIDFGDAKIDATNNEGKSALDIATENNNEELVKLLLANM